MMKKAILLGASLVFLILGVHAQSLDDARKAMDEEQYARAKGILENLVQKQPKRGINYFYLGQVHLVNEHLDSAKQVFSDGLAADRRTLLNSVGLGIVDLFSGNVEEAEKRFSEVVDNIKRRDYLELYHIGRAYVDAPEPDYGKAMQYLNQALARSGRRVDPLIHLAMGDAYFGAGERSPAFVSYREAITLNPALTRAEIQMAIIIRGSRAWQEAIEALEAIVASKPNYAPTYRELAETYNLWSLVATDTAAYRQRNETAVDYYRQYMDLTDYSIENRIRYADFLVYARDYDELQIQAQELSELEDINPKVLRYLGHSSYHKDEFAKAEDALDKMLDRMETERVIGRDYLYLGLAKIHLAAEETPTDMHKFDEGIDMIKKGIPVDSSIVNDLNIPGTAFMRAGKYLEAAKLFEISSGVEGSRNQISDTYYFGINAYFASAHAINSGQPKDEELIRKADTAFAFVIETAPDQVEPYLYRARNQSLLEDRENPTGVATPYYEAYINVVKSKGEEEVQKAKSTLIEIYNTLAYQYVQSENFAKAKELLDETMKLDPDNAYAKEVLNYIQQVQDYNATTGR